MPSDDLIITIGTERFAAELRRDLAPRSCGYLQGLLPHRSQVIHARWSGDALWSPLADTVPPDLLLPAENATGAPVPGQLLLYAGARSVPELYIPYDVNRFACKAGPLEGNPVISIADGLERLAELGHRVLWRGALELRIEVSP